MSHNSLCNINKHFKFTVGTFVKISPIWNHYRYPELSSSDEELSQYSNLVFVYMSYFGLQLKCPQPQILLSLQFIVRKVNS